MGQCQRARTEIHEILHTFGYDHMASPNSIMTPYAEFGGGRHTKDCATTNKLFIDKEIIEDLIDTYS